MVELTFLYKDPPLSLLGYGFWPCVGDATRRVADAALSVSRYNPAHHSY
jgi:hypothetical protein